MLTSSGTNGSPVNVDVSLNKDGQFEGMRGTTWLLQVNEIVTDKKQMERKSVDLYQKEFAYNKDFWDRYNALPMDRKYISAQKDLERKTSLDKQFQKN